MSGPLVAAAFVVLVPPVAMLVALAALAFSISAAFTVALRRPIPPVMAVLPFLLSFRLSFLRRQRFLEFV
jgi:hypothetical protein